MPAWSGQGIAFAGNEKGYGGLWIATIGDPGSPSDLEAVRVDRSAAEPVSYGATQWSPDAAILATTYVGKNGPYGNALTMTADGASLQTLWPDPTIDSVGPAWSPDGSRPSLLVATNVLPSYAEYDVAIVDADARTRRVLDTRPLSMNARPAMFSPDGTRIAARAGQGEPTPGDILILDVDGDPADPAWMVRCRPASGAASHGSHWPTRTIRRRTPPRICRSSSSMSGGRRDAGPSRRPVRVATPDHGTMRW